EVFGEAGLQHDQRAGVHPRIALWRLESVSEEGRVVSVVVIWVLEGVTWWPSRHGSRPARHGSLLWLVWRAPRLVGSGSMVGSPTVAPPYAVPPLSLVPSTGMARSRT